VGPGPESEAPSEERAVELGGASAPCETRLAKLEAAERARLLEALGHLLGRPRPRDPGPEVGHEDELRRDDENQEELLCRVARRHLRQHWLGQREAVRESLGKSLADHREQEKNLRQESLGLAEAAGLGPEEQARFGERYAPLRKARIEAVLAAVRKDPPAFEAVLEEAIGLFAEEDRLVLELGGSQALRRLREGKGEGRTAIVALAAALAELPWDESIRW
jgi:hypothetical protein